MDSLSSSRLLLRSSLAFQWWTGCSLKRNLLVTFLKLMSAHDALQTLEDPPGSWYSCCCHAKIIHEGSSRSLPYFSLWILDQLPWSACSLPMWRDVKCVWWSDWDGQTSNYAQFQLVPVWCRRSPLSPSGEHGATQVQPLPSCGGLSTIHWLDPALAQPGPLHLLLPPW